MNKRHTAYILIGIIIVAISIIVISYLYSDKGITGMAAYDNDNSYASVYYVNPTKYKILNGSSLPDNPMLLEGYSIRMTRDEFEPLSLLIRPNQQLTDITVDISELSGSSGTLPSSTIDPYIVKIWWQGGYYSNDNQFAGMDVLTQELLLKNDALVRVSYNSIQNELLVTNKTTNQSLYINVTSNVSSFPANNVTISDAATLQPFNMTDSKNRQLWFIVHVPADAQAGNYTGDITIRSQGTQIANIPITIEVLPFDLNESRLIYGLYYHHYVISSSTRPTFANYERNPAMYALEMQDMKDHGVRYPAVSSSRSNFGLMYTALRNAGLPTDKHFQLYANISGKWQAEGVASAKAEAQLYMNSIASANPGESTQLYVYGIDEASGSELLGEREYFQAMREIGAKTWVSCYPADCYASVGDLLDMAVYYKALDGSYPPLWHGQGNKIVSYSNPQVATESAEVYRTNYGLALWSAGYDGAFNYAYQKRYGDFWNDFDHYKYREETFVYPTSTGLVSTIQWEGFREGVDDTRYLATLLDRIEKLEALGLDASTYRNYLDGLEIPQLMTREILIEEYPRTNPELDLDAIRYDMMDRIIEIDALLQYYGSSPNITIEYIEFDEYTNLSQYNRMQLRNISNVTFRNSHARIRFADSLNLSRDMDFTGHMQLSERSVYIDSSVLPELNTTTLIEFYNVNMTGPVVHKDGQLCADSCSNMSYDNMSGIFTFIATGFSTYTLEESAVLNDTSNGTLPINDTIPTNDTIINETLPLNQTNGTNQTGDMNQTTPINNTVPVNNTENLNDTINNTGEQTGNDQDTSAGPRRSSGGGLSSPIVSTTMQQAHNGSINNNTEELTQSSTTGDYEETAPAGSRDRQEDVPAKDTNQQQITEENQAGTSSAQRVQEQSTQSQQEDNIITSPAKEKARTIYIVSVLSVVALFIISVYVIRYRKEKDDT